MGPSIPAPITWGAIRDWCDFHDRTGEDVPFLDACCREMDAVFIENYVAKLPK